MDFNRRMRSSNVQGFASKMLTLYEEEEEYEEDCTPLYGYRCMRSLVYYVPRHTMRVIA